MIQVNGFTQSGYIEAIIDDRIMMVPDEPSNRFRRLIAEWESKGNVIPPFAPPVPTADQVNQERDRRIASGFTFQGKKFDFDPESKQRVTGAATLAGFAVSAGAQPNDTLWSGGDLPFAWIAQDNSLVPMDAQTCFAFGRAAAAHESAHIFAARQIKDMDPVPSNFADDIYWP